MAMAVELIQRVIVNGPGCKEMIKASSPQVKKVCMRKERNVGALYTINGTSITQLGAIIFMVQHYPDGNHHLHGTALSRWEPSSSQYSIIPMGTIIFVVQHYPDWNHHLHGTALS